LQGLKQMAVTISGTQSAPVGVATFGSASGGIQGGGLNTGVAGIAGGANIAPVTVDPTFVGIGGGGQTDSASIVGGGGGLSNAQLNAGQIGLLQNQLDQLDPSLQTGLGNIGNSYNLQANRLDQQKAVGQRNYNTGVQQNDQSYANNRNGIATNTRANTTALQRLLGMNGAGNSSASYELAPYAAGLQGSTQLNQAQQVYGNNRNSLDTSWGDTQRSYTNSLEDLNNQRYQQENGLRSSIAQSRAQILNQMGQASGNPQQYASQVNDLLSQITQLGQQYQNPVLRSADVSYAAPTTSNYFLNGGQAQAAQGGQLQGGAASDLNPTFLNLLAGGQRDPYGNLIAA
jgi:hypothetical protein